MNKEEIIAKVDSLTRKVKTPGRAYSKAQREEMRKEISVLQIELGEIKFQEDIVYINEFEQKHPSHLIPEKEALKNKIDEIANNTTDPKLIFVLEFKIKSFNSEISYLSFYQKTIGELIEGLDYLNKNERIPSSNPNAYKKKEEIQKSLAGSFRALNAINSKLNIALNEIQLIIDFFNNDNKLTGFVYLSGAIFSDASNFEKGYGTVEQGSKKMYFAFNGNAYKIESEENSIPKIENRRTNPDLIPFEIEDGNYNYLWGYKNSSGEIIIPAKFKSASPFVNGFAKVGILKEKYTKYTYGLIDYSGRIVLPCEFIELGDVYNDVVMYKRHIYKDDMVQTWNFDWKEVTNYVGLLSGYLINTEIKQAIDNEIDSINEIEKTIPTLKTRGEVDNAYDKIRNRRERINFYLKYITDNDTN